MNPSSSSASSTNEKLRQAITFKSAHKDLVIQSTIPLCIEPLKVEKTSSVAFVPEEDKKDEALQILGISTEKSVSSSQRRKSYQEGTELNKAMRDAVHFYELDGGSYMNGQKVTMKFVANKFGVSTSALERRINGLVDIGAGVGRHPIFTKKEEDMLVKHLLHMAEIGYGYDRIQVLNILRQCVKLTKDPRFKNFDATHGYFQRLLIRYPELTRRKIQALDRLRATEVSESAMNHFFDVYKKAFFMLKKLIKHDPTSCHIFNMDEIGFTLRIHSGFTITKKKAKSAYLVDNDERTHMSIVACVCAAGFSMEPFFLVKGKRRREAFDENVRIVGFTDSHISMTPKAFITNESFRDWSKLFVENLKGMNIKGALLVLDNHTCHTMSLDTLQYLLENNVICVSVPPHSTHISNPLDVAVFKPFKEQFRAFQTDYMRTVKKVLSYDDFPILIKNAWEKAFIAVNIKSGPQTF